MHKYPHVAWITSNHLYQIKLFDVKVDKIAIPTKIWIPTTLIPDQVFECRIIR